MFHDRPGLTDHQKEALTRLATKPSITDFERGQLAAFRFFGDPTDSKRAQSILDKHEKEHR